MINYYYYGLGVVISVSPSQNINARAEPQLTKFPSMRHDTHMPLLGALNQIIGFRLTMKCKYSRVFERMSSNGNNRREFNYLKSQGGSQ
jgi:hypothetical protein